VEYEQVTVLFVDVVRSMDIAAALDVERLREIMTDVLARSAPVLRRYDATAEYNGDVVMAIFGAPIASLSRDGGIAWLRRTHRLGRGNDRERRDLTPACPRRRLALNHVNSTHLGSASVAR
jgi:class 3 adenylate cyclase